MSTTKKKLSTSKLSSSREYREAFVSAFLKRYIPFQIRTIRNKRNMSQKKLAEASKVTQGVISRAEDPDYGNLTFNTVLRIAAGFDLAFVGKFVPFSELLKLTDETSEKSLDLPGFVEECDEELNHEALEAARRGAATAEDNDFLPHVEPHYGGVSIGTLMESAPQRNFGVDDLASLHYVPGELYYNWRGGNSSLADLIGERLLSTAVAAEGPERTPLGLSGTTDINRQGLYPIPKPPSMEASAQSSPRVA